MKYSFINIENRHFCRIVILTVLQTEKTQPSFTVQVDLAQHSRLVFWGYSVPVSSGTSAFLINFLPGLTQSLRSNVGAYGVTLDGVWISNWIY
jgi:hypothetical protein